MDESNASRFSEQRKRERQRLLGELVIELVKSGSGARGRSPEQLFGRAMRLSAREEQRSRFLSSNPQTNEEQIRGMIRKLSAHALHDKAEKLQTITKPLLRYEKADDQVVHDCLAFLLKCSRNPENEWPDAWISRVSNVSKSEADDDEKCVRMDVAPSVKAWLAECLAEELMDRRRGVKEESLEPDHVRQRGQVDQMYPVESVIVSYEESAEKKHKCTSIPSGITVEADLRDFSLAYPNTVANFCHVEKINSERTLVEGAIMAAMGIPSPLFSFERENGIFSLRNCSLSHLSYAACQSITRPFCDSGRKFLIIDKRVRELIASPHHVAQALGSVCSRERDKIRLRINSLLDAVVGRASLIAVLQNLRRILPSLFCLFESCCGDTIDERTSFSVAIINHAQLLYEKALVVNSPSLSFFYSVFHATAIVFCRYLDEWMSEGVIRSDVSGEFFLQCARTESGTIDDNSLAAPIVKSPLIEWVPVFFGFSSDDVKMICRTRWGDHEKQRFISVATKFDELFPDPTTAALPVSVCVAELHKQFIDSVRSQFAESMDGFVHTTLSPYLLVVRNVLLCSSVSVVCQPFCDAVDAVQSGRCHRQYDQEVLSVALQDLVEVVQKVRELKERSSASTGVRSVPLLSSFCRTKESSALPTSITELMLRRIPSQTFSVSLSFPSEEDEESHIVESIFPDKIQGAMSSLFSFLFSLHLAKCRLSLSPSSVRERRRRMDVSSGSGRLSVLRFSLLSFISSFLCHCEQSVIASEWNSFESRCSQAHSLKEIRNELHKTLHRVRWQVVVLAAPDDSELGKNLHQVINGMLDLAFLIHLLISSSDRERSLWIDDDSVDAVVGSMEVEGKRLRSIFLSTLQGGAEHLHVRSLLSFLGENVNT